MKIATVCRMNQARSPLAEAVLKLNFPEHEFFSTGVTAVSGTPILKEVAKVGAEWGLNNLKESSESMLQLKDQLLSADCVIVAEDEHAKVIKDFGFKGEIVSCESVLPDYMYTPKDPEGMPIDKARRELGKVAGLSLRVTLNFLGMHSPNKILAVTPNGSSDVPTALEAAHLEAKNRNALLLDADFRAPLEIEDLESAGLVPIYFDINQFLEAELPKLNENEILVHERELDKPEKLYLSPKWRQFLDKCTEHNELIMLTAPRYAKTRSLPDSFIVAALADEFMVISS